MIIFSKVVLKIRLAKIINSLAYPNVAKKVIFIVLRNIAGNFELLYSNVPSIMLQQWCEIY